MKVIRRMRGPGFWQLRLALRRWTIRLSAERVNDEAGPIVGGWPGEI